MISDSIPEAGVSQEPEATNPFSSNNPHIRWMIRRDMAEILAIEQRSFTQPWVEEDFIRALRSRNCIGMICEVGEEIKGYMIYELYKNNLKLVNLAVHPDDRCKGYGRRMINKMISKLSIHRRSRVTIEVRESNLDGQLFLKKMGFQATAVKRRVFQDTYEDAYAFRYVLKEELPMLEEVCEKCKHLDMCICNPER
jgi:ribosomal-protein-alanine N-acetyltransferase